METEEKAKVDEKTLSNNECLHKEDTLVRDVPKNEKWYVTSPIKRVDKLDNYDINCIFKLLTEYSSMEEKEVRQRLYSASAFVGLGFDVEGKFEYIDNHGHVKPINNTDIDFALMVKIVEESYVNHFEIDEDISEYYDKKIFHDIDLTDENMGDLLEDIEAFLCMEYGRLMVLTLQEDLALRDFFSLIAVLVLPVEKGFAKVFDYIEQFESSQQNE